MAGDSDEDDVEKPIAPALARMNLTVGYRRAREDKWESSNAHRPREAS